MQNVKTIHSRCHQVLVKILKAERAKRSINQADLSKQMREPQSLISRVESGMRRVDVCEFLLLAKAIGFDPVRVLRQLIRCKDVRAVPARRRAAAKRLRR